MGGDTDYMYLEICSSLQAFLTYDNLRDYLKIAPTTQGESGINIVAMVTTNMGTDCIVNSSLIADF